MSEEPTIAAFMAREAVKNDFLDDFSVDVLERELASRPTSTPQSLLGVDGQVLTTGSGVSSVEVPGFWTFSPNPPALLNTLEQIPSILSQPGHLDRPILRIYDCQAALGRHYHLQIVPVPE